MSTYLRISKSRLLIFICATALGILGIKFLPPCFSAPPADPDVLVAQGLDLMKKGNYHIAFGHFSQAVKSRGSVPTVQWCLAICALQTQQTSVAEEALARVVAMTLKIHQIHQQALELLEKHFKVRPYSCVRPTNVPPGVMRWDRSAMPLRIFISPGKELPANYNLKMLDAKDLKQLAVWTANPALMDSLAPVANYRPEYMSCALDGLKKWDFAMKDGLFTYSLTENHTHADILLFWCKNLFNREGFTYFPPTKGGPVIILISLEDVALTDPKQAYENVRGLVAREFGSAWGLGQSPNGGDLMYPAPNMPTLMTLAGQYKAKDPSAADRLTLRALYTLPAKVALTGVKKAPVTAKKKP